MVLALAVLPIGVAISPSLAQTPVPARMPQSELTAPGEGGVRITSGGIVANWYPGVGKRRATIIVLGGSEGGLGGGAARQAADLAARGYAVLHLAYFGAVGLPAKLDMVPLEYFDKALTWVRAQNGDKRLRVGLVGASKGAEAALIIAARHPEIKAVVAGAPSAAVWPGIDFSGGPTGSSWSLHGRPVPYLRYGAAATSMFAGYASGLETLTRHPEAAIPVRAIEGKVLLICGKADALWPSCAMANIVQSRRGKGTTILSYDDAGHAVFGVPVDRASASYASLGTLGGTPSGNDDARADGWPKVIAFLDAALLNR